MKENVTVLYHRDADGFGAAYAAWLRFGDGANYISVQYGEPRPVIPKETEELFIVDFSYDFATCCDLASRYYLTIIDHHKTAESVLKDCDFAIFDMNKSGAVLTYEHFFEGEDVPLVLQYVQDRDLWRFDMDHSKEINAYIASLDEDFEVWHMFDYNVAYKAGHAIQRVLDKQIESATRHLGIAQLDGHRTAVVNNTANISESCHKILEDNIDVEIALSYFIDKEGVTVCSLRSRGDVDVSEIAKKRGGGGHKCAAGFRQSEGMSVVMGHIS